MNADALTVVKAIAVTDAVLESTTIPEADHPAYNAATTYALADRVIYKHRIYESVQPGNVGKTPDAELDWWADAGPTNRWAIFDSSNDSVTTLGATASLVFAPGQAVNAIQVINATGLISVRVRLIDPVYGTVYDRTVPMISVPSSADWYAWFFEPHISQKEFSLFDLPTYPTAKLHIDATTAGTGSIGALVFGLQRNWGIGVERGARLSMSDYSFRERNRWGGISLKKMGYAKNEDITLHVKNESLDATFDALVDMRSTPALFIVKTNNVINSLNMYGFITGVDATAAKDAEESTLQIKFESMS